MTPRRSPYSSFENGDEMAVDAGERRADCSPSTKRHLDRLEEWADALEKDGAVTCADLARIEARWRAIYRGYSSRLRSGAALPVGEVPPGGVPVRDAVWLPPAPEATVDALGFVKSEGPPREWRGGIHKASMRRRGGRPLELRGARKGDVRPVPGEATRAARPRR